MFKLLHLGLTGILACFAISCAAKMNSERSHTLGTNTSPRFKKVMIIVFENEGFSDAIKQPNFKSFASRGALLSNFKAEMHPSQPNYIAMISGDTHKVDDDQNHDISEKSIADLLEAKGKTWKNYAEGYPGNCFTGKSHKKYVRKHTPFISFSNIQNNTSRCKNIVSADALKNDIANDSLPDFAMYTPDMDNDGHDTGVAFADRAFKQMIEPLIQNSKFMKDMLLIVTFDEDDRRENNHIYTVLYGSGIKPGSETKAEHNHYSLLKLVEDEWSLGSLGLNDDSAAEISGVWANGGR